MSAAWAIDMNGFPSDVSNRLIEWGQRTSVRTGFDDEGLFIFVRKKETTKQALSHLIRNLARNWNVELPGGWDWLRPLDCFRAVPWSLKRAGFGGHTQQVCLQIYGPGH